MSRKRTNFIALATTIVVVAALGFLYIGVTHRDRCIKAGNVGCTILPWSGHASSSTSGWWSGQVAVPGFP